MEEKKIAWERYDEKEVESVYAFADEYMSFLGECKTEREACAYAVEEAKKRGYEDIVDICKAGKKLKAGDKVYAVNKDKAIALFVIGKEPIECGMNILGAHIDSPRLDIKPNPLYEDGGLAYFETHYYGGIKKYQWVTTPLALHGVVCKKDGEKITVCIGEDESDPVFGISDLLIHLSAEQLEKKASKAIEGENLNILVGSRPVSVFSEDEKNKEKEKIAAFVLGCIKEKYGIEKEDFFSAELTAVPAGKPRDYGFDRSMILGYGHDDKVCAYPSLRAIFDIENPKKTCVCLLVDKEEIGSVGATGMHSRFFENVVAKLIDRTTDYSDLKLRDAFADSCMLSSDVTSAFDPIYASAFEKNNVAYFGKGVAFIKYTGARGKSGSNDASAEYIAKLRKIMDDNNICYQSGELGKVDLGGGGTIAYILGNYGMDVIDSGIPVQNMHAPWEVVSKADLYEGYKSYKVFLENA